jgi:glutathione S-transferase
MGKFPLLQDERRDALVPESTIIIEYLALHYPGRVKLIPDDPDQARDVRLRDRFFDNYLHTPMQKLPADRMRPPEQRDAFGEAALAGRTWALGDQFTMADCAAAPALFYGNRFYGPFDDTHPRAMAYLARLMARPSYARVLQEAQPYMHLLPA